MEALEHLHHPLGEAMRWEVGFWGGMGGCLLFPMKRAADTMAAPQPHGLIRGLMKRLPRGG